MVACQSSFNWQLFTKQSPHFSCQTERGTEFNHLLCQQYINHLTQTNNEFHSAELITVFIEGDGQPWSRVDQVAFDPTPKKPLLMQLMSSLAIPALYLGRPCYFQQQRWYDQETLMDCHPIWWTHRRYAPEIVASMSAVLDKQLLADQKIILVAHSGGASLALLMAQQLPQLVAIVTLAGNLDTEQWTKFHHYSPLMGSLNPMNKKPLDDHIVQLHLIGEQDKTIIRQHSQNFVRQQGGRLVVIADIDHTCCWSDAYIWHLIQQQLDETINNE
jgi:predicted alpha/beta hydrolase family esterase